MRDAPVHEMVARIGRTARALGKVAGFRAGSAESICTGKNLGYDFAALMTDLRIFTTSINDQFAAARAN